MFKINFSLAGLQITVSVALLSKKNFKNSLRHIDIVREA